MHVFNKAASCVCLQVRRPSRSTQGTVFRTQAVLAPTPSDTAAPPSEAAWPRKRRDSRAPPTHARRHVHFARAVPVVFYDVTTSPFSANTVTESLIRRGRQREIEIGASQYFVNVLALVTLVVARSRDEFRVSSFACKYLVGVRKIAWVDRVSLAGRAIHHPPMARSRR